MSSLSINIKWKYTKILIFFLIAVIVFLFSFNRIDPFYMKEETIIGSVTQSVQMFPRYWSSYNRVIVKFNDGSLIRFEVPLHVKLKKTEHVELQVFQRRITGFKKYKLLGKTGNSAILN